MFFGKTKPINLQKQKKNNGRATDKAPPESVT